MKAISVAVLFLLALALPAAAQEATLEATSEALALTGSYVSKDGEVIFRHPDGWIINEQTPPGDIHFFGFTASTEDAYAAVTAPGETQLQISIVESDDPSLDELQDFDRSGAISIANAYRAYLAALRPNADEDAPSNYGAITAFANGEDAGAQFVINIRPAEDDTVPPVDILVVFVVDEGLITILSSTTAPGGLGKWSETARAIAESVRRTTAQERESVTPEPSF